MKNNRLSQMFSWKGLLAIIFALAIFALTPGLAAAQSETGNFCIEDYNLRNCTANDFGVKELYFKEVITMCGMDPAHPGQAYVVFEAVLSTAQPIRYDVGIFLALDGYDPDNPDENQAIFGDNCYHDYLDGDLTTDPEYTALYPAGDPTLNDILDGPWWDADGDVCGDMDSDTAVIKTLDPVWIACVDSNGDGSVDVDACGSYNQLAIDVCSGIKDAIPGTTAKCGCVRLELPFTPTAIEGLTFSANSKALPTGLALSGLGLLLIVGVLLSVYLRRRAHAA
jgi:hypothetical protein